MNSVSAKVWVLENHPYKIAIDQVKDCFHDQSDVQRCLEDISWVSQVDIRHQGFDVNVVRLHSRIPIGRWDESLIDQSGVVFQATEGNYAYLPRFDVDAIHLAMAYKLQREILSVELPVVAVLRCTSGGQWEIEFEGGQLVKLGSSPAGRVMRMRDFFLKYPKLLGQKNTYFDFRNDRHVALGKKTE